MTVRITRREAIGGLAVGWAAPAITHAGGTAPQHIVSLNPCLDAILVQVADRGQIAALSHYSAQPGATSIGALGVTFPITHESAEEIVALRPDLVLVAGQAGPTTRAALQRMNIPTATFGVPFTVDQSCQQVRRIAALVARPERGKALVARIQRALAASAPAPGDPPLSALVFEAGGLVSARGTLIDEVMTRAGFTNAATRYGLTRTGAVSLERLIADPPQVLLAGEASPGAPTWADRIMHHPALAAVGPRMYRAAFPEHLTFCGGPVLIEAAATLAAIRIAATRAHA